MLRELEQIRKFAGQKKESILQILHLTAMYSNTEHTVMLTCLGYDLVMQEIAPKYYTSASIELPKILMTRWCTYSYSIFFYQMDTIKWILYKQQADTKGGTIAAKMGLT